MARDRYGQSSHAYYMPGLDASPVDQHILNRKTSWRGVRGVAPAFEMPNFDLFDEDELFSDDIDDFFLEEEALYGPDDSYHDRQEVMGRLYRPRRDQRLIGGQSGDAGVIQSLSSRQGHRGARMRLQSSVVGPEVGPRQEYRYGAQERELRFGPLEYRGGAETMMLSAAALAIVYKLATG